MSDNENVVSFELDTTKIDKSIDKLKEALPNSFNKEIERLKKGIDNLNKQTEKELQKQAKLQAKEQEKAQKELQQQLLKQEKEKAKEQLKIQKELLLAKAKEEAKAQKDLQKQLISQEREKAKQREQELKAKHKEALLEKEKENRANDLKARIKQDRQELKARIQAKTPLKPQGNQYTKSLTDLQEQHQALQIDYANLNDKNPTELKNKQLEAIKKQQENLNDQAYNIKQARLQNQSPLLSAEQKRANKGAIDKQVELYNKQKQNTIKNAMNIDKTANNIKDMAKNINDNRINFSVFNEATRLFGVKTLALGSIITAIGSYILKPLMKYETTRIKALNTQEYANESGMTFNQARAVKMVADKYNNPEAMQFIAEVGRTHINAQKLIHAFAISGLGNVRFSKDFDKKDTLHKALELEQAIKKKVNDILKTNPQILQFILENFSKTANLSSNFLLRMFGFNNGKEDILTPLLKLMIKTAEQNTNEKYAINSHEIIKNTKDRIATQTAQERQGETAEYYKFNTLSKALQKSDETLLKINEQVTRIAFMIDRYMQKQNNSVMDTLADFFSPNSFNTIPTPYGLSPSQRSVTITNKANQGGTQ